jgi:hypothetical protein
MSDPTLCKKRKGWGTRAFVFGENEVLFDLRI